MCVFSPRLCALSSSHSGKGCTYASSRGSAHSMTAVQGSRMTSSTISIHTTKPTPLDLHSFPPEHTGPVPPLALNTECRTLLGNISFLRAGLL